MELQNGTEISVDQNPAMDAPYAFCVPAGCAADYKLTDALLVMLKHGRDLAIRAIDGRGQAVSFVVPLGGLGETYVGPPAALKQVPGK